MAFAVDEKAADIVFDALLRRGGTLVIAPGAAKLRFYARDDLQRVEGLGDIVVRADRETEDLVAVGHACGQHEDGEEAALPNFPAERKAVGVRQHHVEQGKVDVLRFHAAQRLRAGGAFVDGVAVVFEIDLQQIGDLALVVHDEDGFVHSGSPNGRFGVELIKPQFLFKRKKAPGQSLPRHYQPKRKGRTVRSCASFLSLRGKFIFSKAG